MNNKNIYRKIKLIVYGSSFIVALAGCAKVETTRVNVTSDATTQTTIAADEVTVNDEFDQALDEAIAVLSNHKTTITDASVDTSQISMGIITIYYNNKNEADGTKYRQGSDSIHIHGNWKTAGATASITLGCQNSPTYEVFYNNNNTTVTLYGTSATVTNVSGGYLQTITAGDSLVTHIKANVVFTYNDNVIPITYYYWYLNQVRSFTVSGSAIYASTRGDSTLSGGISNVSTMGITRTGSSFYTIIGNSIVQNISNVFLSYNPISGTKAIDGIAQPILATYGVNSQGNAITSGTPYGFNIAWKNSGTNADTVVAYYY